MARLIDIASVVRSKNAGPLYYTFDVMFDERSKLKRVLKSDVITQKIIADLYEVNEKQVQIIVYEQVNSFKITIPRKYVSGSLKDDDIYGCQQHRRLAELVIDERA